MPNTWWTKLSKLFSSVEKSTPAKPATREALIRPLHFAADQNEWLQSTEAARLISLVRDTWQLKLIAPQQVAQHVDILNTKSSQGFILHLDELPYNDQQAGEFLIDHFATKVKAAGYLLYMSDERTAAAPRDQVQRIQRHYLKPPIGGFKRDPPWSQLYGNVSVSYHLLDSQPHQVRFSATSYTDHKYQEPLPITDLIMQITEPI